MHILSVVLMLGDLHRELDTLYSIEGELGRGGLIHNAAPVVPQMSKPYNVQLLL